MRGYVALTCLVLINAGGCLSERDDVDAASVDVSAKTDISGDDSATADEAGHNGTDAGTDAVTDTSVRGDHRDCQPCSRDNDCATGYICHLAGEYGQYDGTCVAVCENDGGCRNGFVCYSYGAGNVCLPESFNCVACVSDPVCPEGSCCNLTTGSCQACANECDVCSKDYECAAGFRCVVEEGGNSGRCLSECVDGKCAEPATCIDNGSGIKTCRRADGLCGGCPSERPYMLDGAGCVQCRDYADCASDFCCDASEHECRHPDCSDRRVPDNDCSCRDCADDAGCAFYGVNAVCLDDRTCFDPSGCGGLCTAEFPRCVVSGGVEMCGQCLRDNDCSDLGFPGCLCSRDPDYRCVDSDGTACAGS